MRRLLKLLVVLAILAIVAAVIWRVCGDRIRTRYVLFRCDHVWRNMRDVQVHLRAQVNQAPLSLTVGGEARFKVPDAFRLDLDQIVRTTVMGRGDQVWVVMPSVKAAVQVIFEKGSPVAAALRSRRAGQWLKEVVKNPGARVLGKTTAAGERCYAIRVPATQEPTPTGTPVSSAGHTMLYVDTKTLLPVEIVALDANLTPVAMVTLEEMRINQGLPDSDFDFRPSADMLVMRRVFDPEHPESLILPPIGGSSSKAGRGPTWDDWLSKMGGMWNPQGAGSGGQPPR
jgi:outer membrane lipoprotein-sorting protein